MIDLPRILVALCAVLTLSACGGGGNPADGGTLPDAGEHTGDAGQTPACDDGERNGDETGRDCGGSCGPCDDGEGCGTGADCHSGYCNGTVCATPSCTDGAKNGTETDVDCGGPCGPCGAGKACAEPEDCVTGVCQDQTCRAASCVDGVKNGDESDLDCGGGCSGCAVGASCAVDGDCESGACTAGACAAPACNDGRRNGDETDIDCGGTCPSCGTGRTCAVGDDCQSGVCGPDGQCAAPSCSDGLQNGGESAVDCGGPSCGPCADGRGCAVSGDCQSRVCSDGMCQAASCTDGVLNGGETDADCGGPSCGPCADNAVCGVAEDCASGVCIGGRCRVPLCTDGVHNGTETDVDCGGPSCGRCTGGKGCATGSDCHSFVCDSGTCSIASCTDGVKNQFETDVDCGGTCSGCNVGQTCSFNTDCQSGLCKAGLCQLQLPAGLYGEYYANYVDLVDARVDPVIDFSWPNEPLPGVTADAFSVRWTGFVDIPATGNWTFLTRADDGARLWVNGQRIIEDWRGHAPTTTEGSIFLTAGARVPIRLEYCDIRFAGAIRLSWRGPGVADQVIPATALVNDGTPSGTPGPLGPYQNPVLAQACPDPSVLTLAGPQVRHQLVCGGGELPLRESQNLVGWSGPTGSILPAQGQTAPWALDGSQNRAPEVHRIGSRLVVYYSALALDGTQAIGVSTADGPGDPFTHVSSPLLTDPLGVTDPSYFEDGTQSFLVYRQGGNSVGIPAGIYLRELTPDGLSFAAGSAPVLLLENAPTTWEGSTIGGPRLVKRGGEYFLFYEGGGGLAGSRVGVAKASSVTGPYVRHGAPILANNATWVGPGQGSVVTVEGADFYVYSAWPVTAAGDPDQAKGRYVLMDLIRWSAGGWPEISNGTPSTGWMSPPGNL